MNLLNVLKNVLPRHIILFHTQIDSSIVRVLLGNNEETQKFKVPDQTLNRIRKLLVRSRNSYTCSSNAGRIPWASFCLNWGISIVLDKLFTQPREICSIVRYNYWIDIGIFLHRLDIDYKGSFPLWYLLYDIMVVV